MIPFRLFFHMTLALALLLAAQTAANAAVETEPIGYVQSARGKVVAVTNDTAVQAKEEAGKVRPLFRNAALYQQDMVVTAAESKAQLMFNDGTILSMAESSQLRLNQFHYEFREKKNNILDFLFGPGLFRFLTGKLVKKSPEGFKLETPLGSLGIRGTDGAVVALPADTGGHSSLCNELADLAEADPKQQQAADFLFEKGLEFSVKQEKVYHFSGPSDRLMTFTDKATQRTALIPRGEYLVIDVMEGSGEAMEIPAGVRGLAPSVNLNIAPPAALQGVFGSSGDSIGKETEDSESSFDPGPSDTPGRDGLGGEYGGGIDDGAGEAPGGGTDSPGK